MHLHSGNLSSLRNSCPDQQVGRKIRIRGRPFSGIALRAEPVIGCMDNLSFHICEFHILNPLFRAHHFPQNRLQLIRETQAHLIGMRFGKTTYNYRSTVDQFILEIIPRQQQHGNTKRRKQEHKQKDKEIYFETQTFIAKPSGNHVSVSYRAALLLIDLAGRILNIFRNCKTQQSCGFQVDDYPWFFDELNG